MAGCDVGGLFEGFSVAEEGSVDFSLKLKRALVLVGAGLMIAGERLFLRKSKYADGGVMGVLAEREIYYATRIQRVSCLTAKAGRSILLRASPRLPNQNPGHC